MKIWSPWLPEAALRGAFDASLSGVAHAWSLNWLAAARLRLAAGFALPADGDAAEPGGLSLACEDVALQVSPLALDHLAARLLEAPEGARFITAADKALARALVQSALEDFVHEVAPLVGLAQSANWSAAHAFASKTGEQIYVARFTLGEQVVTLRAPRGRLVTARRTMLSAARLRSPLTERAEALASTTIRLEARIGGCSIAISDLTTLAVGDVLVLDQSRRQPVPLRLTPTCDAVAHGHVQRGKRRWEASFINLASV